MYSRSSEVRWSLINLSFARVTLYKSCNLFVKMSVDFGPIPMPTSPIQEYFERKYKTASQSSSPAIPVSPQIERGIEEQLTNALNELAKTQAASAQQANTTSGSDDGTPLNALPQRRGSLAASTGYTAPSTAGRLKRRSLVSSGSESQGNSRRPSR